MGLAAADDGILQKELEAAMRLAVFKYRVGFGGSSCHQHWQCLAVS
jgi:hypothetical protein